MNLAAVYSLSKPEEKYAITAGHKHLAVQIQETWNYASAEYDTIKRTNCEIMCRRKKKDTNMKPVSTQVETIKYTPIKVKEFSLAMWLFLYVLFFLISHNYKAIVTSNLALLIDFCPSGTVTTQTPIHRNSTKETETHYKKHLR